MLSFKTKVYSQDVIKRCRKILHVRFKITKKLAEFYTTVNKVSAIQKPRKKL